MKKLEGFDIQIICSTHGPVLKENTAHYLELYKKWASYTAEEDGICIAYCSVYGHTKAAVEALAERLRAEGRKLAVYDLARCDMYSAVTDAFRYSHLLLASTTYYGEVFPFMREYLAKLKERMFKNRKVYLVENGSWSPIAASRMKAALEDLEGLDIQDKITIKGFSCAPINIEW